MRAPVADALSANLLQGEENATASFPTVANDSLSWLEKAKLQNLSHPPQSRV